MIEKNKLIKEEWCSVEDYLKKDTSDSIKLAVLEAEKVFIKTVDRKTYKTKSFDEKIKLALKEIKNPEIFLRSREKALKIKNIIGFDIEDPYSGIEIVTNYKEAIEDMLFGIIDEAKYQSIKYRFWPFYYRLFSLRKKILKIILWILVVIGIMLFIADTSVGKNLFDSIISQIHLIIRIILTILLILFLLAFFVTFSIILIESKAKNRSLRK